MDGSSWKCTLSFDRFDKNSQVFDVLQSVSFRLLFFRIKVFHCEGRGWIRSKNDGLGSGGRNASGALDGACGSGNGHEPRICREHFLHWHSLSLGLETKTFHWEYSSLKGFSMLWAHLGYGVATRAPTTIIPGFVYVADCLSSRMSCLNFLDRTTTLNTTHR